MQLLAEFDDYWQWPISAPQIWEFQIPRLAFRQIYLINQGFI
jgi:hypothetical protein